MQLLIFFQIDLITLFFKNYFYVPEISTRHKESKD